MTQQEYISLVNQAKKASYEYYVLSTPSLTDAAFDALLSQVEECEQQYPEWTLPDSPTQQVGSDLSDNGRRTIAHRTPMLSCQKAKSHDAVLAWLKNTVQKLGTDEFQVSVEYKYDGISCSLVYQDGQLISAATRGDKFVGQDITSHAALITNIPQQLPALVEVNLAGRVEIRGEIVCPKANLGKISRRYADCRTAASSLCNMEVPAQDCALLAFIPWKFDAPCFPGNASHFESMMFAIQSLGFDCACPRCFDASSIDSITEYLSLWDDRENRDALLFPIDGLVLKVDDKHLAASLGATSHHPHGNIAYKFAPNTAITTCTRIEIKVGKTGRRTPVAHFDPVTVMGRQLCRASLCSETTAAKLGIIEGSTIEVGLVHDVTPKVFRVIPDAKNHCSEESGVDSTLPAFEPETTTFAQVEEEVTSFVIPNMIPAEPTSQETENDAATTSPAPTFSGEEDTEEPEQNGMAGKLIITALSILAIVLLFPVALALAAFGIPVLNGSLMDA